MKEIFQYLKQERVVYLFAFLNVVLTGMYRYLLKTIKWEKDKQS